MIKFQSMDTIADMLTKIRNAQLRNKEFIEVPFSRIKLDIARLLVKERYLNKALQKKKDSKKHIRIFLTYNNEDPGIKKIKKISLLGKRVYKGYKDIPKVLNGMGIAILSTSKGVMTDEEARKNKIGGEIICEVY